MKGGCIHIRDLWIVVVKLLRGQRKARNGTSSDTRVGVNPRNYGVSGRNRTPMAGGHQFSRLASYRSRHADRDNIMSGELYKGFYSSKEKKASASSANFRLVSSWMRTFSTSWASSSLKILCSRATIRVAKISSVVYLSKAVPCII